METYIKFIIRHRLLVLLLIAAVTAAAAANITRGVLSSSLTNLFFGENPEFMKYEARVSRFGNDEVIIFAFENPSPLAPKNLKRLQAVIHNIRSMPGVWRVNSILNAQHIQVQDDMLVIESFADQAGESPQKTADIFRELVIDPFVGGMLLSRDGNHTAVLVELEPDQDRAAEEGPLFIEDICDIFQAQGISRGNLHCIGMLAAMAEVIAQTRYNIYRLLPLVVTVLFLSVYMMFRRFWPVLITLLVGAVAVIWVVSFAVHLDKNINIFITLVPLIICIVATSDVIHLCSAYMLELAHGELKEDAILKSGAEVGMACLFTSLTTFVGFVSMSFVPVPVFRQLGLVLGAGIGMALLVAMTLSPILFTMMKQPRPWRTGTASKSQYLIDQCILGIERLIEKQPRAIVFCFAVVFILAIIGNARLEIETRFSERFSEDNAIRIDEIYYNEQFEGANFLDIYIDTPAKGSVLDPETFSKIAALQKAVERMPGVDNVLSLVDLIEIIHQGFASASDAEPALPGTREALAQYLLLFDMAGGEELERFVDDERQTVRLSVRLSESGVRATYNLGEKVKNMAPAILGDAGQCYPTGLAYLIGMWLDEIVAGQSRGLIFAFVVITLMMVVGLRSLRCGLWSMIPNAFPLLILGGYVGLFWDKVDSDAMAIGMVAIGIGVDDTIHFLIRLKIEAERSGSTLDALPRTFHFSGRAIIITSVVLVAGFLPLSLSDYFSIHIYGTLLPMTLVVALFADLLLLAALVKLGVIRFPSQQQTSVRD